MFGYEFAGIEPYNRLMENVEDHNALTERDWRCRTLFVDCIHDQRGKSNVHFMVFHHVCRGLLRVDISEECWGRFATEVHKLPRVGKSGFGVFSLMFRDTKTKTILEILATKHELFCILVALIDDSEKYAKELSGEKNNYPRLAMTVLKNLDFSFPAAFEPDRISSIFDLS